MPPSDFLRTAAYFMQIAKETVAILLRIERNFKLLFYWYCYWVGDITDCFALCLFRVVRKKMRMLFVFLTIT